MTVAKGQKVIVSKYSGTEVKIDDVEYIIVKQGDILATVEESELGGFNYGETDRLRRRGPQSPSDRRQISLPIP